eukprot:2042304-Rhodomonas_salina.1
MVGVAESDSEAQVRVPPAQSFPLPGPAASTSHSGRPRASPGRRSPSPSDNASLTTSFSSLDSIRGLGAKLFAGRRRCALCADKCGAEAQERAVPRQQEQQEEGARCCPTVMGGLARQADTMEEDQRLGAKSQRGGETGRKVVLGRKVRPARREQSHGQHHRLRTRYRRLGGSAVFV